MIPTLFAQFRRQHANGHLTSELLMTHADQYLVKATVSIGEQVVASAMAADQELTVADDSAKARALAMLGFSPEAKPDSTAPVELIPAAPPKTMAANMPKPAATKLAIQPLADEREAPVTTEDEDMGRPLDSFAPEEAPAPSEVPASSLAATALENFDNSHPVDLSDIIAQTDVEMTRLGWSSTQGRSYLETTFNKRSRQQLTDEELLTFLLYLESQATPTMG